MSAAADVAQDVVEAIDGAWYCHNCGQIVKNIQRTTIAGAWEDFWTHEARRIVPGRVCLSVPIPVRTTHVGQAAL